jgi:prevent-host-death family protein
LCRAIAGLVTEDPLLLRLDHLVKQEPGPRARCGDEPGLIRLVETALSARSTDATLRVMARDLTQRELRNESGEIMRALDAGESFTVTRNGVPVAELTPARRHRFVEREAVLAAFRAAAPIDPGRWRADLDRHASQDPTPRA